MSLLRDSECVRMITGKQCIVVPTMPISRFFASAKTVKLLVGGSAPNPL